MKYKFTNETVQYRHITLHRIVACENRGKIKKGTKGGFIGSYENLSQDGAAWVGGEAIVIGDACVVHNAIVNGHAIIEDSAFIGGNARVGGYARIANYARVDSEAKIKGSAVVAMHASVGGAAIVKGSAEVTESAQIRHNAIVRSIAHIYGGTIISYMGCIESPRDYLTIGPIGSRDAYFTAYKTQKGAFVICGCFNGYLDEFEAKVRSMHKCNMHGKEYLQALKLIKLRAKYWKYELSAT